MGNTITETSDLPYKDRGGWLVGCGLVEILLGATILLMSLFALMSLVTSNPLHAAGTPAGIPTAGVAVGVGVYVLIAAFFVVAGVGSILRRNWARILMLIGSAIWLPLGVVATLAFIYLFPKIMAVQHPVPPAAQHIERIVMGLMVFGAILFGILLPLAFLIFYTRKSVKATCLARERAPAVVDAPSRKLPVAVIILVIWEALAAVSAWACFFSPVYITCIFGFIVRGWPAIAFMLVFSALSAAAAWLIYKMQLAGWTIALWKLLFFEASAGVSLATGGMSRLIFEISQTPAQEQFAKFLPHFMTVMMITGLLFGAAYLALLIYSRRFLLPVTVSAAPL